MKTQKYLWASVMVIAAAMLFTCPQASAQTYTCNPADGYDCAEFTGNTITFLSVQATTCTGSVLTNVPCNVYFYKYQGSSYNQITVAIPLNVTETIGVSSNNNAMGCSQWSTDGSGDSNTTFGAGLLTHGVCRIPPGGNSPNSKFGSIAPADATFYVATDLVMINPEPANWQISYSKNVRPLNLLTGPAPLQGPLPISTTQETITTKDGNSITYSISDGKITIDDTTSSVPGIYPVSSAKLCLKMPEPTQPYSGWWGVIGGDGYYCETVEYGTQDCDIKTTGTDPCRFLSGYMLCY